MSEVTGTKSTMERAYAEEAYNSLDIFAYLPMYSFFDIYYVVCTYFYLTSYKKSVLTS